MIFLKIMIVDISLSVEKEYDCDGPRLSPHLQFYSILFHCCGFKFASVFRIVVNSRT